jgi:hypothetical protein
MYSIIELVGIYGEVNTEIIKKDLDRTSEHFQTLTNLLLGIKSNLENVPI